MSLRLGTLVVAALLQTTAAADEVFNRGLIAVVNDQGQVYLGWRLLKDDPADIGFNVYRRTDGGAAIRVNSNPLTTSTNLVDTSAPS